MRTNKSYIIGLVVAAMVLSACDEVNGPYRDPASYGSGGDPMGERVQKIVLEEFTGFRCPTCPAATDLAQDLRARNPEQVILISVHAGFFAELRPGNFTYDFNTQVGTELDNHFSVTSVGTPNGLINRTPVDGEVILTPPTWNTRVAELLEAEAPLTIRLSAEYSEASRTLDVRGMIRYFEDGGENDYISVYLLENNFVQVQVDNRKSPSLVQDYVHQHVLRTSFNGTWGEPVNDSAPSTGDIFEKSWSLTVDEEWNADELEVVAIVHDFQGSFRILQAEAIHVGE